MLQWILCITGQLGNADIIQPGLLQLQPTIEEEMDTQNIEPLPPLQGILTRPTYFCYTENVLSSTKLYL